VLVGRTSTISGGSNSASGAQIGSNGLIQSAVSGDTAIALQRLSDDGDIIQFRKDTTQVGSISVVSSDLAIFSSASSHAGLRLANGYIAPTNNAGTISDNTADLGISNYRFKDLYLSGGLLVGGTGSANKLDDYEEGTWTPVFQNDGSTSYTVQLGKYRKIGDVVIASFHLDINTGNAIGGNHLVIENLPFTVANSSSQYGNCGGFHCNIWATSSKPDNALASPNTTTLLFYRSEGQTGAATITGNDIGTGNLLGHVIFFVS
jgi:hypothetical protein